MSWLLCPLPYWLFESWYLNGEHVCGCTWEYILDITFGLFVL